MKRGKVLFDSEADATPHAKAAGLEINYAFRIMCLEKLSRTSNIYPCCQDKYYEVYKVDSGNVLHIRVTHSAADFDSKYPQHSNKQLVLENLNDAIVILKAKGNPFFTL